MRRGTGRPAAVAGSSTSNIGATPFGAAPDGVRLYNGEDGPPTRPAADDRRPEAVGGGT